MIYLVLSIAWLVIALVFGFTISYSYRIKNITQVGLGFIFGSFVAGIFLMLYAITQIL